MARSRSGVERLRSALRASARSFPSFVAVSIYTCIARSRPKALDADSWVGKAWHERSPQHGDPGTTVDLGDAMKHSTKRRLAFAIVLATGAAGLVVSGVAFGSGPSRTERFRFISTVAPTGTTYSAIATGAFTDGGTATIRGRTSTLKLRSGTIRVTQKTARKPVLKANEKTCYEHLSENGTYKIVGGTGKYNGIKGSGKFSLTLREIGPLVHGKCDLKTAKRVAAQAIITATGPVTLR